MRKLLLALGLWLGVVSGAYADGTIDTLTAGGAITGTESIPMFQSANPALKTTPNALDTFLSQTTKTLTNKTLTSPTIAAGALSGTFSGTPTWSGIPKFTGLSAGTIASGKNLGLDSSNNLVTATVSGGGGTIPSTTSALAGDGSGNAVAVTGTGTNCVLVNGSSAACGGGGATGFGVDGGASAASVTGTGTIGNSVRLVKVASGWATGTLTLPAISAVSTDTCIRIEDGGNFVDGSHTLTLKGGASDGLNGGAANGTIGAFTTAGVFLQACVSAANNWNVGPGSLAASTAPSHQFASGVNINGLAYTQPAVADLSGFGTGVATFLATPSSANLAAALTDETGTGAAVFASSPALTGTPTLGANGGTVGAVKIFGNTSGDATITVPAVAGTSTRFQLPATNGSNTNVLQTDGSGNTSWVAAGGGGGISCPTGFSASGASCKWTQTANNSATNIAWTGLANDNYKLTCSGLTPATASNILQIQFGEGGTPTWKVTGYANAETYIAYNAASAFVSNGTAQQGFLHDFTGINTYDSIGAEFGGLSQTVTHTIRFSLVINESLGTTGGSGAYTGDTTAITAIRIITDNGSGSTNGNISSGTCTLYYEAT